MKELEPIPEAVVHVEPSKSRQGVVVTNLHPGRIEPARDLIWRIRENAGVRRPRRTEIGPGTHMQLDLTFTEPNPTASRQYRRLLDLAHTQNFDEELSRRPS
jgi:hypothetical protein